MAIGTTALIISAIISTTIAAISSITSGVIGAVQAGVQGQYQAEMARYNAQQQNALLEYQSEVAQNQALNERQKATQIQEQARENERSTRQEFDYLLASQVAATAGAGLDIAGSPLEVMGLTNAAREKYALAERRAGEVGWNEAITAAQNYETDAVNYKGRGQSVLEMGEYQAQMANYNAFWGGTMSIVGGVMGAGSAIAGGISDIGSIQASANATGQASRSNALGKFNSAANSILSQKNDFFSRYSNSYSGSLY